MFRSTPLERASMKYVYVPQVARNSLFGLARKYSPKRFLNYSRCRVMMPILTGVVISFIPLNAYTENSSRPSSLHSAVASSGAEQQPSRIGLRVRTVMGNGLMQQGEMQQRFDKRLGDLSKKLSKLQYQEYSLVSSQGAELSVTEKKVLQLPKGHSLAVRLLNINKKKVGMWLKWKDGSGMKILDTRMHFHCGENMVTGTNSSEDSGMILAISVKPLP